MVKPLVKLWNALHELKDDEFKKFKWLLKDDFPAARLEKAEREDTVDLMVQKYGDTGAMKETMTVLEKICRNDLVQGLKNSCPDPKDLNAELKGVQHIVVYATLDPDTAHPNPIRSGDREQVHCSDARRKLLNNPEGFYRCVCWSGQRIDQQDGTKHTES